MELNLNDLRSRAEDGLRLVSDARISAIERLHGGNSSLTYLVGLQDGDIHDRVVLKIAPPGLEPTRNRDVLRQAKVLRSLREVEGVAVPRVLFESAGEPPEVPPFFAMEFADGESVEPVLDRIPLSPEIVETRSIGGVRMLAALHRADAGAIGLGNEAEISLNDELAKWERAFESVDSTLQYGHERLASKIASRIPPPESSAVSHGDYRLGNMLCRGTEIVAVIDWELWSRSDPRIDLAWFLALLNPLRPGSRGPVEGLPDADRLRSEYQDAGGVSTGGLNWFRALAQYKDAAALALLTKYASRRSDFQAEENGRALIPAMLATGHRYIEMG